MTRRIKELVSSREMKLTSLSAKGYLSLRNVEEMAFGSLTVLIGANASGKSNIRRP